MSGVSGISLCQSKQVLFFMIPQTARTEKLDLRLSRQAREVLRSAAIAAHRSMSEIAGIDVQLLRH
jgi:hypothetical protein